MGARMIMNTPIGDKLFQNIPRRVTKFRENRPRQVEKSVDGQKDETRMWTDAERDGRPAEYRWRPLRKFRNFIPCTTPLECRGVTLPI